MEKTLALLFRPISKLLIKNGVPVQLAIEALKRAMVDVAASNTRATDSHVSLKTGVHRKDVRRLRGETGDAPPSKRSISPLPLVMTYWANTPPFCTDSGDPLDLPRSGRGDQPGFDALVRKSRVDLPPATVLNELLAQGLVAVLPDDTLRLLSKTYVPNTDDARLAAFDATISDHIAVAVHNATADADAPRHFDQVLRYSHLSQASVDQLEIEARKTARAHLEALNTLAHELQMADEGQAPAPTGRFVTGAFIVPTPDMPKTPDTDPNEVPE